MRKVNCIFLVEEINIAWGSASSAQHNTALMKKIIFTAILRNGWFLFSLTDNSKDKIWVTVIDKYNIGAYKLPLLVL